VSVPRAPLPHLVALACGVLAAVAVGCGDRSNLIPPSRADSLSRQLSDIKAKIDQGECDGITDDVRKLRTSVTSLSGSIDSDLRRRLREGADSLLADASDQCAAVRLAQTDTQTTDTTPTETQTTETQTVTTDTTATATTPTETTPAETTTVPPVTTPTTTTPDGVTGTTPDNGNGGVVPPEDGTTP
jgi:hypothetical protein